MYSINLLSNKEFDELPYNDVDISLGLADPKKGRAFIRQSGIPALDLLVIGHEINELMAKVSSHEENGIRYKKGGAARSIVPMILGALATVASGGAFGPFWTGLASAGGLLGSSVAPAAWGAASGAGMGAYAGARHPEQLGGAGMGALTGGLTGAASGWGAGQLTKGAMAGWSAAGKQGATSLLSKTGSAMKGAVFGAPSAGAPAGATATSSYGVSIPASSTSATYGGLFGQTGGGFSSALPFGGTKLGSAAYQTMGTTAAKNMLFPTNPMQSLQRYEIKYPEYNPYQSLPGGYQNMPQQSEQPTTLEEYYNRQRYANRFLNERPNQGWYMGNSW